MLLENVGHLISELIAYSCHFLTPKTQKLGGWGQANLLQSFMYAWSHGWLTMIYYVYSQGVRTPTLEYQNESFH